MWLSVGVTEIAVGWLIETRPEGPTPQLVPKKVTPVKSEKTEKSPIIIAIFIVIAALFIVAVLYLMLQTRI